MGNYYDFGKSFLNGAILIINGGNDVFLDVINNNFIGVIIGAIVSTCVTYKVLKVEKKYDIEIEVITEKILNPLFEKYHLIKLRKENNVDVLVSAAIFEAIDDIFFKNTCWYFVTNKKIKPVLITIRNISLRREQEQLLLEFEKLYNLIESIYIKRYS